MLDCCAPRVAGGSSASVARFANALFAVAWCSSLQAHPASGRALAFAAGEMGPPGAGGNSSAPRDAAPQLATLRLSGNSNDVMRSPPAPPGVGPRYLDARLDLAAVLRPLPGPDVVLFEVEPHNKARTR